jgi:hypothetical protein
MTIVVIRTVGFRPLVGGYTRGLGPGMRLGVVTFLAVLLAVAASAEAGSSRARLYVVGASPLVVTGSGFRASERVRLTASSAGDQEVRWLRATRVGGFRTVFGDLDFDRCGGLLVTASGARGSRASLKLPQLLCPPALRGP